MLLLSLGFVMFGLSAVYAVLPACTLTLHLLVRKKHTNTQTNQDVTIKCLCHAGTTPQCSHILLLLTGVCEQICDVYKFDKSAIPSEFKDVVYFFHELLQVSVTYYSTGPY